MAKILLANSPLGVDKIFHWPQMPLGILYIAAMLEQNHFDVCFVDFQYEPEKKPRDILMKEKPVLFLITGCTFNRFESFKLAKIAKEISQDIITVYGGVHATFTAHDTLKHIKDIDIVVRGEGEYTALAIAEMFVKFNWNIADILGISYRKNGKTKHNPGRLRIKNINC